MATEIKDNLFLINAPAGSGKTTKIKSMLREITTNNPQDNILCITYTNRAVDELVKDIDSDRIDISTIHTYINALVSPFWEHEEVVKLYFEIYGYDIENRINDDSKKESKDRYIENFNKRNESNKINELNIEVLKKDITKLHYNENKNNSLYYGGLGHDDLISFAGKLIEKYPKINKKIQGKYKYIFIDEYQDTSTEVLEIFYNAVVDSDTKLYLLGDKMQQIYSNYDGGFEEKLKEFDTNDKLDTNYRSSKVILDILNNIYNSKEYEQIPSENSSCIIPDFPPQIIITAEKDECVKKYSSDEKTMCLYLLNGEKFSQMGCGNLYTNFSRMEMYAQYKKYTAVDVLSDNTSENVDILMKLMFSIDKIIKLFDEDNLGGIIAHCKENKGLYKSEIYKLNNHRDKVNIFKIFQELRNVYMSEDDNVHISNILVYLKENNFLLEIYRKGIDETVDYENVLNVSIKEVRALANYLEDPLISTQHGVKGEGHDSVVFIADDSTRIPIVHMYKFFEIWSSAHISIDNLEYVNHIVTSNICELEDVLGLNVGDLKKLIYEQNKQVIDDTIKKINDELEDNEIFKVLYGESFSKFLKDDKSQNVTNAVKCLKRNPICGVLTAFKLFYVGCSRAKKNLTIIVEENEISNFKESFISKVEKIGFQVIDESQINCD